MNCEEVKEQYSEYLDCCLGERQDEVESHLTICPICKKEIGQLRKVLNALNCLPQVEVPPDFLVRLNERLDSSQKGWFARVQESITTSLPSRALALAATIALIVLSVFYFQSHELQSPGGRVAFETPGAHNIIASPGEAMPSAEPVIAARPSPETGPVHSVALGDGPAMPEPSEAPFMAVSQPETLQIPSTMEVGSLRTRNPTRVPYVDRVVLLKASNPSVTAAQVRRAAASLSALHLDYSETIIFVLAPMDSADLFLQALETMGSTETIAGPVDRGLPTALFQVIVIPNR